MRSSVFDLYYTESYFMKKELKWTYAIEYFTRLVFLIPPFLLMNPLVYLIHLILSRLVMALIFMLFTTLAHEEEWFDSMVDNYYPFQNYVDINLALEILVGYHVHHVNEHDNHHLFPKRDVTVIAASASSSTCNSSSDCSLREWLVKLQEESNTWECTLSQLEKSTTLLSKVNYSTASMRLTQIAKLKKTIANLKGEIEIISLACSSFDGPDCNQTKPLCDSKCISCVSNGQCSNCSGNWDGATCSVCKTGWNGTLCNIPICDSKCTNCTFPGVCSVCSGNWNGTTCSNCKLGWNGTDCNTPLCDSKCISCASAGQCSNCSGNWDGATCSVCKTGWNGTLCNIPICDSKCMNCTSPGTCANCTGNWNGTTCSVCKSGWNGTDCNSPICDSKCISCASPGLCISCSGNWNGTTCSNCKLGWNGTDCNTPICDSKCISCASADICTNCTGNWNGTTCSVCKSGWSGIDCNTPPLILTSAQIAKFKSLLMPNAKMSSSNLLFKASRDGFAATSFHAKCDNKGPTIVIIKATSGAIFGGYASINWQSGGGFMTDGYSFLFSLVSPTKEERFTKLLYQYSNTFRNVGYPNINGIYNENRCGPVFGGDDIFISDNSNSNTDSHSNLCNSYCDSTMIYFNSIKYIFCRIL